MFCATFSLREELCWRLNCALLFHRFGERFNTRQKMKPDILSYVFAELIKVLHKLTIFQPHRDCTYCLQSSHWRTHRKWIRNKSIQIETASFTLPLILWTVYEKNNIELQILIYAAWSHSIFHGDGKKERLINCRLKLSTKN